MRSAWKFGVTSLVVGYFVGCAPVNFEKAPEPPCGSEGVICVTSCEGASCINSYSIERRVGEAMADVLFVIDNSGSMSYEHDKMATKFPTFIQNLDGLNVNYRIGMITTDVANTSPSPSDNGEPDPAKRFSTPKAANGNGAFQSGNLLQFSGGRSFLSGTDSDRSSAFISMVRRQETLNCEASGFLKSSCPSDDERGIYSANLLVEKEASAAKFFRPTAHLAVVILADEDERGISDSRGATNSSDYTLIGIHPLDQNWDVQASFINRFKNRFPGKTLSVHPIIVKPGDSGCRTTQANQIPNVRGDFGYAYSDLKDAAGGTMGSICDGDYGSTLTNIASSIANQVTSLPFSCRPINDDYDVTFDPQPAGNVNVTADFSKLTLNINTALPPLTKVTLKYGCVKQ
ncbi:MAG: hypothetical protein AAB250_13465 [Bdellovibrionota bacterium]